MRIAVSGSHATGKSTLIAELAQQLDDFEVFEEPYYVLEQEGHLFEHPPGADDFEVLFRRSVEMLRAPESSRILFDRSPADYLAYRAVLDPAANLSDSVADAAVALSTLDLVVLVPIEVPDRVPTSEYHGLRRRVDGVLHEMFVEQNWGFEVPVVVVHGTPSERVDQVLIRAQRNHRIDS